MSQDFQTRDAQTAAEADAHLGADQITLVCAEAFLTETLLAEFDSLLADVLDTFPKLEETLASPLVSHEEKMGILDRTLGSQASKDLLSFLKVVSRRGRLDSLRAIHRQAHELYNRIHARVRVRVATAIPLSAEFAHRIAGELRTLVDGEPVLEQVVEPDLIGGIVVRVGDTVYDGSIATQLETVRQQMIDRSGHEIQSRRDRFRDPAGD